ncbi:MAG: DNA-binding protein [Acidianus infernus]|nr:DNA-binding protein [Acidianus infernus]
MGGLTKTEKILLALSQGCRTLEALEKKTGISREELLVYLTRLHKRGIIYRKWQRYGGRKFREYCLKKREELI